MFCGRNATMRMASACKPKSAFAHSGYSEDKILPESLLMSIDVDACFERPISARFCKCLRVLQQNLQYIWWKPWKLQSDGNCHAWHLCCFRRKTGACCKGHNPHAYMVHTKKKQNHPESILGPWGQTSLDKVPVAKVLFIPLQVSNKLRSEKLHTFLWLQPQCRWIFFPGTTPLNFENTKVGAE